MVHAWLRHRPDCFSSLINLPRWDTDRIDTIVQIHYSYILNGTPKRLLNRVGLWNNHSSVYHSGIRYPDHIYHIYNLSLTHLYQIPKNSFFSNYGSVIFNIFLFFNWRSNHESIEEYQSTLEFILHVGSYLWLYALFGGDSFWNSRISIWSREQTIFMIHQIILKSHHTFFDSSTSFWTTLLTSFDHSW